jgi:hypothetical protein
MSEKNGNPNEEQALKPNPAGGNAPPNLGKRLSDLVTLRWVINAPVATCETFNPVTNFARSAGTKGIFCWIERPVFL